jgi:hypothetical protein
VRLVLDSSVITEGDWHLSGPSASALLAAARRGQLKLVVPELAVREVVNSHREREVATIEKLDNARASLRRLQGTLATEGAGTGPTAAQNEHYDSVLRELFTSANVEVAPIPEVPHDEIVERALARRRPFDRKGHDGYRDTLIWHTVLGGITRNELTVLATDNHTDFADEQDKTKLHAHLRADLRVKRHRQSAARICGSLDEAVAVVLEPAREVVDLLQKRLAKDDDFRADVEGRMEQQAASERSYVDDSAVDVGIELAGEPFVNDIVDYELEDLHTFGGASVADAYALTDSEFVVWLEMAVEAVYDVEVSTAGFWHDPDRVPAGLRLSYDESSAYFSGFASATLHFGARYDTATGELSDLQLNHLTSA